jgi:DNA-binding NtrC family response regulator
MDSLQRIVVVTDTPALQNDLLAWLAPEAYRVSLVTTFASARVHLKTQPDLIITQVKLAEYNGLHLALRARSQGIPAVVIGERDAVVASDAVQVGATYVPTDELGRDQILSLTRHLIPSVSENLRDPYTLPIMSDMTAGDVQTRSVDA